MYVIISIRPLARMKHQNSFDAYVLPYGQMFKCRETAEHVRDNSPLFDSSSKVYHVDENGVLTFCS